MTLSSNVPPENLTKASNWMRNYIITQDEIEMTYVIEGISDEEWDQHVHFVAECFAAGVKPVHFLDTVIKAQSDCNHRLS